MPCQGRSKRRYRGCARAWFHRWLPTPRVAAGRCSISGHTREIDRDGTEMSESTIDLNFGLGRAEWALGDRRGHPAIGRRPSPQPSPPRGCPHRGRRPSTSPAALDAAGGPRRRQPADSAATVADPESVTATVDAVAKTLDRIDILVNSAGIVMLAPARRTVT